jgi:hypothetical protein
VLFNSEVLKLLDINAYGMPVGLLSYNVDHKLIHSDLDLHLADTHYSPLWCIQLELCMTSCRVSGSIQTECIQQPEDSQDSQSSCEGHSFSQQSMLIHSFTLYGVHIRPHWQGLLASS